MNYKLPFSLFQKQNKSGNKIWYYTIYDEQNKRHQYSTGKIRKGDALTYCLELYKQDKLSIKKNNKLKLKNYTKDWYIYDKCPYIRERITYGFTITKGYAFKRRHQLDNYIIPFFGNININEINQEDISNWIIYLKNEKKLSNASANNVIKGFKILLSYAFAHGDFINDISKSITLLKNDSKTHGIFSKDEISLLQDKIKLNEIWHNDSIEYTLNLTASKTGMRIGELQGLQKKNVFPTYIIVENTWDPTFGLKDTKTHKSRTVPISPELYDELLKIIKLQTLGNFVFSNTEGKTPITQKIIYKYFKKALANIGISQEEQKQRYLTFHSYRHYVNTQLVTSGLPTSIVQSIIGHVNDDKMTEHYTHIGLEDQKAAMEFL